MLKPENIFEKLFSAKEVIKANDTITSFKKISTSKNFMDNLY